MIIKKRLLLLLLTSFSIVANTTAYLPIKQSENIERQVDQLLLMAGMTSVKKPIAIKQIKQAVRKVCAHQEITLCSEVKSHLKKYDTGVNLINAKLLFQTSNREKSTLANQRGIDYQSNYYGYLSGYSQLNDYLSFNAGVQLSETDITMENTYLSFGTDWLQLDLGTKPHWLSPMDNSAMLLSTHAQTIPTVSISNSIPLTNLGISYELFFGELSTSDKIYYQGELISGKPIITGMHFSISPWQGFSLGVNRILQSGGGERGSNSLSDFLGAFFQPTTNDNTNDDLTVDEQFGNQAASIVSQFSFSGDTPFSLYFEYAGEDTSRGFNFKLGNSALSAGLYIPSLSDEVGLRLEVSEWQNGWYVHHVYQDGLTNQGHIIGHWGAESRYRENSYAGDGVGAYNMMAKLYWQMNNGDNITLVANITENESYTSYNYDSSFQLKGLWSTEVYNQFVEYSVEYGKDIFADSFYSISVSLAW